MVRLLFMGLARLLLIMLLASFAGALLLRAAPGFTSDERELNSTLSAQSIQAIRQEHLAQSNIPRFYWQYLKSLLRGDLGTSMSLNQPVRALLRERLPVTLRALGFALLAAWSIGLGLGLAVHTFRSRILLAATEGASCIFISTPAAALALIFVLLRLPPVWAAALL